MNSLNASRELFCDDYYRWLIKTNVLLRNGSTADLLTFIPYSLGDRGNGIDSINAGIGCGLQGAGFVQRAQSVLYTLKNEGLITEVSSWVGREYDPKYPDGFKDLLP